MVFPRLAAGTLILLALAAGATSATAQTAADSPTGLHGFLLRADESPRLSFPRTPAFAWNPVPGATGYEFQLSTSDTFRDNGRVWQDDKLTSPVAAPLLTLPWISGSPHSLYARVRAVFSDHTRSPWSDDYGFDMAPPAPPTPLPAAPGLLRWTPVQGADSYEVWLLDAKKHEIVRTNVLDEREYYTLHPTSKWIGTVHWRIRALRSDVPERLNSIPATHYGAWSPAYTSTNPDFAGGDIRLGSTVSDIVSNGDPAAAAHKLMPAFTWTGNQALDGSPAQFFRVEVFTDRQCLNRVFTGPLVASQAYAPRPQGPLSLPTTAAGITGAAAGYLPDGAQPVVTSYDGRPVVPNEQLEPASPTLSAPDDLPDGGATTGGATGTGGVTIDIGWDGNESTKAGAPVDVWDTNWPQGGYYWTVIAVAGKPPDQLMTSVAAPGAMAGVTSLPVANSEGFSVGDQVTIGTSGNTETATVIGVDSGVLTVSVALKSGHGIGETVLRPAGSGLSYRELELPQDVCRGAAEGGPGRVARFGKASEPALSSGGDPFASGLSTEGDLVTATVSSPTFYSWPVVSWSPALGATTYEVQWGHTRANDVFVPEFHQITAGTSLVLPVTPGTWSYRVRGFDFLLPTGAQGMSWSDTERITVAPPTFVVVDSTSKAKPHKTTPAKKKVAPKKTTAKKTVVALKRYDEEGFSVSLPKAWKQLKAADANSPLTVLDKKTKTTVGVTVLDPFESTSLSQAAQTLKQQFEQDKKVSGVTTAVVTLPAGPAILLTARVKLGSAPLQTFFQYYISGVAHTYLVKLVSPTVNEKQFSKLVGSIARTFRVL